MKKLTSEDVISRFREKHGDIYDYSLVNYINQRTKISVLCKKHGEFKIIPTNHWNGQGCAQCAGVKIGTKKEFISKANKIHGGNYIYDNVDYVNNKTHVEIVCRIHGMWLQRPDNHLSGSGCPKCRDIKNGKRKILTIDEFKDKCYTKHKNKFNYELVKFNRLDDIVTIICPRHGKFDQRARSHLNGNGCRKCGNENRIKMSSWKHSEKFLKNPKLGSENGIFYVLKFTHKENGLKFAKIGITKNSVKQRYRGYSDYNIITVKEIHSTILICSLFEEFYKKKYSFQKKQFIFPENMSFCGHTECFTEEIIYDFG